MRLYLNRDKPLKSRLFSCVRTRLLINRWSELSPPSQALGYYNGGQKLLERLWKTILPHP